MIQLEILTPDTKVYSGEATGVNLPGSAGAFEVLTNHAALISTLDKGKVIVRHSGGKEDTFVIDGGLVEVLHNKVIVLAESVVA